MPMTTVQTIGVIDAGTMANGIARACVMTELSDVMTDVDEERIARRVDSVASSRDRLVKSLRFSALSSVAASTMRPVAASARMKLWNEFSAESGARVARRRPPFGGAATAQPFVRPANATTRSNFRSVAQTP